MACGKAMGTGIFHIIIAALALLSGGKSAQKPLEVQGVLTGHDTLLQTLTFTLISDDDAWSQLWAAHKGAPSVNGIANVDGTRMPTIDFAKSMVVAYFAGQQSNVVGYEVVGIQQEKSEQVIQLREIYIQNPVGMLITPYVLIQLPRSKETIEVEVTQDGKSWKSLGTLAIKAQQILLPR